MYKAVDMGWVYSVKYFWSHSRLRPATDSVRPGPNMLADCIRFRG